MKFLAIRGRQVSAAHCLASSLLVLQLHSSETRLQEDMAQEVWRLTVLLGAVW